MIEDYCTEEAVWKHLTDTNEYNEPIYAASATIKCRIEQKIKLIKNKFGKEVVSDTKITTTSKFPVQVDDLIDERTVISVLTIKDFDGKVEGYEVML